jgi:4-amino-4-deoxy-L-arabinose transferase-like glycosyltransferase
MSTTTLPRIPARGDGSAAGRRLRTLVSGRAEDPAWVRPALLAILALASVLCLWDLTRNGYSNTYYAAAVKSGSESWKAWFFGSLDPGSFITVDKPPLSLWLAGLSARAFGFSSFSILLPEALCTIAAVGLLYATVRRSFGAAAGLIAAGALALTPVTVAIGRVNNPDALLVLLLVAAAYLMQRAIESGKTKRLVWCGALVGLAFMTKLLQGWMIVPALAAAYVLAGPPRLGVRIRQLLAAGATMVAVSAAWPLVVTLWPGHTPYIGGSTNGSIWNLIFGYDGFGRLTGSTGGPQGGLSFGGAPGLLRMFNPEVGGQVAWLIPVAALGLVAGLWLTRRAPRTDKRRAALVLFGVWALVHVAVFSSQQGIFHPYYVSALAPAVAALTGAGVVVLARWARDSQAGLIALAGGVAVSAWLAVVLLTRTAGFAPWLSVVIPVAAAVAIGALLLARQRQAAGASASGLVAVAAVCGAIALLAGPASYSVASVGRSLSGNNVLAGPASVESAGGFGGGIPGGAGGPPSSARGLRGGGFPGGPPGGAPGVRGGGFAGGPGGQLSRSAIAYLEAHQGSAKYLLAATGSETTAQIIIETGQPVVTIGGFNGSDPAPTVSQLAKMFSDGELKYILVSSGGAGGPGAGPGGGGTSQAIDTWVRAHGTAVSGVSLSGGTLYRLTG